MRNLILYPFFALLFAVTSTKAVETATIVGTLPGDVSVDNKGAANYTIPIEVIPGRLGIQPDLAISYSSGSGNGILGVGFNLSGLSSISRGRTILARDGEIRTVNFTTSDKLYLDGKRLILISGTGTYLQPGSQYRTEVESFSRITALRIDAATSGSVDYFKVEEKGGRILYYGKYQSADADALHDAYRSGAFPLLDWALKRIEDRNGNYVEYEYDGDPGNIGQHLLSSIEYTKKSGGVSPFAKISFTYEDRNDDTVRYIGGGKQELIKRLKQIDVVYTAGTGNVNVREYHLGYEYSPESDLSRLISVQCKARKDGNSSSTLEALEPTYFDWTDGENTFDTDTGDIEKFSATASALSGKSAIARRAWGDYNGDGIQDLAALHGTTAASHQRVVVYLGGTGSGVEWYESTSISLSYTHNVFLKSGDFNGDGLSDIMISDGDKYYCFKSTGGPVSGVQDGFTNLTGGSSPVVNFTNADLDDPVDTQFITDTDFKLTLYPRVQLADFTGDGRADVLVDSGYLNVAPSTGTGFASFKYWGGGAPLVYDEDYYLIGYWEWAKNVFTDIASPSAQTVDFNGDGVTDYLLESLSVEHYPVAGETHIRIQKLMEVYIADPINEEFDQVLPSGEDYTFDLDVSISDDNNVPLLSTILSKSYTGDFNGDGLTDILRFEGDPNATTTSEWDWNLYLSHGYSSASTSSWKFTKIDNAFQSYFDYGGETDIPTYTNHMDDSYFVADYVAVLTSGDPYDDDQTDFIGGHNVNILDYDQDGKDDILFAVELYEPEGWYISYSDGDSFSSPTAVLSSLSWSDVPTWYNVSLTDFEGDGVMDLQAEAGSSLPYSTGWTKRIVMRDGEKGNLLTKVTNGLGSVSEIRYDPITNNAIYTKGSYGSGIQYPIKAIQDSRYVVSDVFKDSGLPYTVSTTNGIHSVGTGNAHHFLYQYSGGVTDLSGRGFLGYRSFVTWDTETDLLSYQFLTQSFPMTGLVQREQVFRYWESGSNDYFRMISTTNNRVFFNAVRTPADTAETGSYFPFISASKIYKFEDSTVPHYFSDGGSSGNAYSVELDETTQSSQAELLFDEDPTAFTDDALRHHSKDVHYTWFDGQSTAGPIDTTLPPEYDPDDNTVVGFIKDDWDELDIPSDIRFGNVVQTQNYSGYDAHDSGDNVAPAGDGMSNSTNNYYMTEDPLPGSVSNSQAEDFIDEWLIHPLYATFTSAGSADVSGTIFSPITYYSYDSIARVKTQKIDSGSTNTERDSQVEYFYDTYGNVDYQTVKGFMTTTSDPHYIGTSAYTTLDNTFAGTGDTTYRWPTTVTNAHGHATVYEYNELTGKPESVTDVNGYETEMTYDALGRALTVKDVPLNITTTTTITETTGGSIVTVNAPSGIADAVNLPSRYKIETTAPKQPKVTQYLDRMGREIRTIKEAFNSQSAKTDTAYDNQGRVIGVSNPFSGGSPSWWTTTTYDALGRVDVVTSANDTVTTNYYNGRLTMVEVDVTNAKNESGGALPEDVAIQRTVTLVNSRGDTHKIWNADVAPSVSTFNSWEVDGTGSSTPSIKFQLDGFNRVRQTILKDQAAYIVMDYDDLGNQITLKDPDKGVYTSGNTNYSAYWQYSYNALGQMVTQDDANGNETVIEYDTLGRTLEKTITETLHNATETTTWYYYDANGSGNPNTVYDPDNGWKGALQRVETVFDSDVNQADYSNSVATYYDDKGRVKMSLHHIDNKWYYEYTRYDTTASTNRIKKLDWYWRPSGYENDYNTHPANWHNYGLEYFYDTNFSYVDLIIDSQGREWWDVDATAGYDFLDRPVKFQKGSGHWTHKDFDLRTGLLDSIITGTSGGTAYVQNLTFTWDGWGNLQQRYNGKITKTETFNYDNLNRLTSSTVGADTYTNVYAANGNITSKYDVNKTASGTYTYSSTRPHAVTSAWSTTIGYDNNGNMNSRTKTGKTWSYWWSGFDKPRWMFEQTNSTANVSGSEFRYGVDHQRNVHLKFDTSDSTSSGGKPLHYTTKKVYVGSLMEIDYENAVTSGSGQDWEQKEMRIYVSGPEGKLGTFTFETDGGSTDQEAIVYHYDHLGSIESITDYGNTINNTWALDDSSEKSRYSYDAWGQRRDPTDWKNAASGEGDGGDDDLTPRGFTGHEMLDDIGLVHMNGRIYDPLLGRFLSADRVVQYPDNLQSYNRFSYVRNNPLTFIDENGFQDGRKYTPAQLARKAEQQERWNNSAGGKIYNGVALTGVSFVPWLGDAVGTAMDVDAVANGSGLDKAIGSASIAINAYTLGGAPGLTGIKNGVKLVGEGIAQAAKPLTNKVGGFLNKLFKSDIETPRPSQVGKLEPDSTKGNDFTFRGDSAPPDEVFANGFKPAGESNDLLDHALDSHDPPSNFVATSQSEDIATEFGTSGFTSEGYRYTVNPEGGINVNEALGTLSPHTREMEVAVPGGIKSSNIRGATPLNADGTDMGYSILNENWRR